jgi:hypothetical protein
MRWTRSGPRARGIAGRPYGEQLISAGRAAHSRTAKPCGPGARGWRQAGGGFVQPNRASQTLQSAGDGGKRNSSPGRARHKPSTHCAGNAGVPRLYLYARVRNLQRYLHTRPRVSADTRHSLRPLPWATRFLAKLGRSKPRECGGVSFVGWVERSETHRRSERKH